MAIQFENPWLLFLIFPVALFMYFTAKNMIRFKRWRRISIILARSLGFLLVILLLSGFAFHHISVKTTTLFLADSSDSVIHKEEETDFIREAAKGMGRNDEAGVINFGGDSAIELLPGGSFLFDGMQTKITPSFTNLENALVTARSIMPWDHKKRVVLLTDGRENVGDALHQIRQMKAKGYVIDIYPVNSGFQNEVQLQELKIPDSVNLKEEFEIKVNIKSNVNTKAVLRLYNGRRLSAQKKVELNKGENQFAFTDKASSGGMITYRAEVEAESDTVSQNNALSSYTYARDIPEIMMIAQDEAECSALADILKEDMRLTVVNPAQAPAELPELLKYDAFILVNVPADSLSDKFLSNLETAVSHQGKGLLTTGGDDSYGPGGYYKTVLEKILPVNMDIKPKEEEPNLALMLVIDKSGSMSGGDYGISKIELAREAAIRSTEVLNGDDMIGVLTFDDAFKWVVEPQKLDNPQGVRDAIGTIRSGGGTQILPALEEAYNSILKMDAGLKHIILLTDGQAEKEGYEPLIEGMKENGVTLSTVAVGRGADTLLMKALAYGGGGRYYGTDEFTDIPKIFAKEVFLAGKKYLNNRTFVPKLAGSSDILKGIEAVPELDGYVATTAKDTANVIFESDQEDPILACRQYGLGRTAAWTPDVQGVWSQDWMSWEDASRFWKNTVSWLVQQNLAKGYTVKSEMNGQEGIITVQAEDEAFMTAKEVKGTIAGSDGTKREITLLPGAPGDYRGSVPGLESGVYIADITLSGSDGKSERISTGVIVPYSPEYDLLSDNNDALIQKMAYEGGGRILDDPARVFEGELPDVEGKTDPSHALFIVLILLFMLDVALRRINLRPELWGKKLEPVMAAGKTALGKFAGAAPNIQNWRKAKDKKNTAEGLGTPGEPDMPGKPGKADKPDTPDMSARANKANKFARPDKPVQGTGPEAGKSGTDSSISRLLDIKRKRKN